MAPIKRPNTLLQDKTVEKLDVAAATAATTVFPMETMDGDYKLDKFEVMAPAGYTQDATNYYDVLLQARATTLTAVAATDVCTATGANFQTGDAVQVSNSGGGLPAGLSAGVTYFVIRIDANTFKLATTRVNALAGTAIDITTNGTGTQTVALVLATWSCLTGANGSLTALVFGTATLSGNPSGTGGVSGDRVDVVLVKQGTAANFPAQSRFVAHFKQITN